MASKTVITFEVKVGPVLQECLDTLRLSVEVLDMVPEWETLERDRLRVRMQALWDRISAEMSRG